MTNALDLIMILACGVVALLLVAAVSFGLWSTTTRHKTKGHRR